MNYLAINAMTSQKYGFQVRDWDDYRGSLGERIVKKIQYQNPDSGTISPGFGITIIYKDLSKLTSEQIAEEFHRVMEESQEVVVPVQDWRTTEPALKTLRATNISFRGKINPFLFILGIEAKKTIL